MQNVPDNKNRKALTATMLAAKARIAALLIVIAVLFGISACSPEPEKIETEIYAELFERYKYNAVELHDDVRNIYGSAFVYKREGDTLYLFTNYHVTGEDTGALSARFYGRNSYEEQGLITLVGYSPEYDISLLKTTTFPESPYIDLSALVKVGASAGERILCLGNNLGYGVQAQNGIVSTPCLVTNPQYVKNPQTEEEKRKNSASYTIAVIGACAPLNSGNSGAAVYGTDFSLVGMNTWRVTSNSAGDAVCDTCYLTPAGVIKAMYDVLVTAGKSGGTPEQADFPYVTMTAGMSGSLYIQPLHTTLRFKDYRLTVDSVDSTGTDALKAGDVITKIGTLEVRPNDFAGVVSELFMYNVWGAGDKLVLEIERGGTALTVTATELGRVV